MGGGKGGGVKNRKKEKENKKNPAKKESGAGCEGPLSDKCSSLFFLFFWERQLPFLGPWEEDVYSSAEIVVCDVTENEAPCDVSSS